jgi:hypothetical protein
MPTLQRAVITVNAADGKDDDTTFITWLNLARGTQFAHYVWQGALQGGAPGLHSRVPHTVDMNVDARPNQQDIELGWHLTVQWSPKGNDRLSGEIFVDFYYDDSPQTRRRYDFRSPQFSTFVFLPDISFYWFPYAGPGIPIP